MTFFLESTNLSLGQNRGRALIVGCDEQTVALMRRSLGLRHYSLEEAKDADDAFEILAERDHVFGRKIDVVLSGMQMSDMPGHDFLAEVSELLPDTLRILMATYGTIEAAMLATSRGDIYAHIEIPWSEECINMTLDDGLSLKDRNSFVFHTAVACHDQSLPVIRQVKVNNGYPCLNTLLNQGQFLMTDYRNAQGELLLKKGTKVGQALLQKLTKREMYCHASKACL